MDASYLKHPVINEIVTALVAEQDLDDIFARLARETAGIQDIDALLGEVAS